MMRGFARRFAAPMAARCATMAVGCAAAGWPLAPQSFCTTFAVVAMPAMSSGLRCASSSSSSSSDGATPPSSVPVQQIATFIDASLAADGATVPTASWKKVRNFVTATLKPAFERDTLVRVTNGAGEPLANSDNDFGKLIKAAFSELEITLFKAEANGEAMPKDTAGVIAVIAQVLADEGVHLSAATTTVYSVAVDHAKGNASGRSKRLAAKALGHRDHVYARTDHGAGRESTTIENTESRAVSAEYQEWAAAGVAAPDAHQRVAVVVGPSGSGKTSYMLTALPQGGPTKLVTFLVQARDIMAWVKRHTSGAEFEALKPYLVNAEVRGGVTPKTLRAALQTAIGGDLPDGEDFAKRVRGTFVTHAIAALVEESVRMMCITNPANLMKRGGDPEELEAPGPDVRVRVAIDEAGETKGVVRAVIAAQDDIRAKVRRACHMAVPADTRGVTEAPVDLMIGGTGCAAPDDPHGSAAYADKYTVVDMEACYSGWFADVFKLPCPFAALLNSPNPATSHGAAAIVSDLLRNARLAALIHVALSKMKSRSVRAELLGHPNTKGPEAKVPEAKGPEAKGAKAKGATAKGPKPGEPEPEPESADALECYLRGVVLDSMQTFQLMNGLKHLKRHQLQRVLADAMSIDINGFDAIADAELREKLVTKYGVLHDRAELCTETTLTAKQLRRIDVRAPSYAPPPTASATAAAATSKPAREILGVPDDCRGRYVMPAAMRALFVSWCVDELPRIHGGSDADRLERLAWQWGAALQLCVARGSSVRELLRHVCRGREPLADGAQPPPPGRGKAFVGRALDEPSNASPPPPEAASSPSGSNASPPPPEDCPFSSAAKNAASIADVAQHAPVTTTGRPLRSAGAHLVQAQNRFLRALHAADSKPFDCCGAVLAVDKPCAVSVLNARQAPYADVALYSRLATAGTPAAAAPSRRFECVLIQAKLYLRKHVKYVLEKELKNMIDMGSSKEERDRVASPGAMVTRVLLVAAPSNTVDRTVRVPTVASKLLKDQMNVVVHIETDAAGVVVRPVDATGRPLKDLRTQFPALYPLTVRRLTTWGADDDANSGTPGEDDHLASPPADAAR